MIRSLLVASALILGASAQNVSTVILVRHAERSATAMSGEDLNLNAAGRKRAEQLARMLADAGVQAVYTSNAARTIQTAQPLAKRLDITPKEISDVNALVAELKAHPGRLSVVVHHSNTVPKIIEGLGVKNPPAIGETQFDWMFIVTMRGGEASMVALRYGD